jgi:hypothetical protein
MGKLSKLFMALSILSFAVPAFAEGEAAGGVNWVAIAAGFSMAFASGICWPATRPRVPVFSWP